MKRNNESTWQTGIKIVIFFYLAICRKKKIVERNFTIGRPLPSYRVTQIEEKGTELYWFLFEEFLFKTNNLKFFLLLISISSSIFFYGLWSAKVQYCAAAKFIGPRKMIFAIVDRLLRGLNGRWSEQWPCKYSWQAEKTVEKYSLNVFMWPSKNPGKPDRWILSFWAQLINNA